MDAEAETTSNITTAAATIQAAGHLAEMLIRLDRIGLGRAAGHDPVTAARVPAQQLVEALTDDSDEESAANACTGLMECLWPHAAPEAVDQSDWWRTPLGLLCARVTARTDTTAVSHAVAAQILGVTRGSIAQWVHRGTLAKHPDGGVQRASVLRRLARSAQASASADASS